MGVELNHLLRVARISLKERGAMETLKQGPAYLITHVRRRMAWRTLEREDGFDEKYGTDTTTILGPGDFGSTSENLGHAVLYLPTLPRTLKRIISVMNIPYEDFVFIDFGSGKGRTLLIASEFPFKRIIGVELSPRLHAIAQKNIQIYRSETQKCNNFELECVDATSYALPIEKTVFYFFDPFKLPVMSVVLENIRQSLEKQPRKIFIAYVHPTHSNLMDQSGFLECVYFSKGGPPEDQPEHPWVIYTNSL